MTDVATAELKSRVMDAIASQEAPAAGPVAVAPPVSRAKRRYRQDVALFARQVAVLFEGGIPMHQAVTMVAQRTTSRTFGPVLSRIADQIAQGTPVWTAMAGFPEVFDRLTVTMVKAGESSGEVAKTMHLLADSKEFGDEMERKVVNVMLFPLITAGIAFCVMLFLLTVIFPSMATRLEAADMELPVVTQIIWGLGVHAQGYWWLYTILFGFAVAGAVWFMKSKGHLVEFLKLRSPLVGSMVSASAVARFARTFGILLEAGIPVAEALELSRDAVDNRTIEGAVNEMRDSVKAGSTMSAPLARHWYFPPIAGDVIAIGEQSGSMPKLLHHLARMFDVQVRSKAERLTTFLEPVMTLLVAALVLVVALAMFVPYFAMFTQGLSM